jgi:hypothetical protein
MPLNTIRHAIKNAIKYFDPTYTTTCVSMKNATHNPNWKKSSFSDHAHGYTKNSDKPI